MAPAIAITGTWLYLEASQVVVSSATRVPYGVFVFVGTLLWLAFTEALTTPIRQVSSAASLLSKVSFPAESVLLSGLYIVLFNAVARITFVIPVFALTGVRPSMTLALFPVGLLATAVGGFAVGLLLAPVGALYQDVGQVLVIVTSWLYFLTPVAYVRPPVGRLAVISRLNPITPLLNTSREWLTGGAAAPSGGWYPVVAVSCVGLAAGWLIFRLAVPHLIDRIST